MALIVPSEASVSSPRLAPGGRCESVMPAEAGIQRRTRLDSGVRRNDGMILRHPTTPGVEPGTSLREAGDRQRCWYS